MAVVQLLELRSADAADELLPPAVTATQSLALVLPNALVEQPNAAASVSGATGMDMCTMQFCFGDALSLCCPATHCAALLHR